MTREPKLTAIVAHAHGALLADERRSGIWFDFQIKSNQIKRDRHTYIHTQNEIEAASR